MGILSWLLGWFFWSPENKDLFSPLFSLKQLSLSFEQPAVSEWFCSLAHVCNSKIGNKTKGKKSLWYLWYCFSQCVFEITGIIHTLKILSELGAKPCKHNAMVVFPSSLNRSGIGQSHSSCALLCYLAIFCTYKSFCQQRCSSACHFVSYSAFIVLLGFYLFAFL